MKWCQMTSPRKAGKVMAAVLWDEKGVIVMNFLPRGQLWTLDACLYRVGATSQMSELLLLCDSARPQYNMHTNWSHHKLWMDIVAAPTLQSWPLTINLSPVSSFERQPAKTPLHWWPEIGKNYVALTAEDRGHLIPGMKTCPSNKAEEICWQRQRIYWKITAFSNVTVKFCVWFLNSIK